MEDGQKSGVEETITSDLYRKQLGKSGPWESVDTQNLRSHGICQQQHKPNQVRVFTYSPKVLTDLLMLQVVAPYSENVYK